MVHAAIKSESASRRSLLRLCEFCGYEDHLSPDYQCPVIGVGEAITNAQVLERYGSAANAEALLGFPFGPESAASSVVRASAGELGS